MVGDNFDEKDQMFGFKKETISDFFIPKSSMMYNEIFDIEIENIR
jgi:hypothetical protein